MYTLRVIGSFEGWEQRSDRLPERPKMRVSDRL